MTTKVLTAYVPLALAEKVDQIARLERSRGWIMVQAWADSLDADKPSPVPR